MDINICYAEKGLSAFTTRRVNALRLAIARETTEDRKTGNASVTWTTQASCPTSCPHLTSEVAPYRADLIAHQEAEAIDTLSGQRDLRVHIVGDCRTDAAAKLVSSAMLRHETKHNRSAWTYTHAWRQVKAESWQKTNVLASCESLQEIPEARAKGYACALVIRRSDPLFGRIKQGKLVIYNNERLLPCPNQTDTRKPTCVECRLCMRAHFLKRTQTTITFLEH